MTERFNELPSTNIDAIMVANSRWPSFQAEHPGAINTTIGIMIDPDSDKPWQPETVRRARLNALYDGLKSGEFGYQSQSGYVPFLKSAGEQIFGSDLYNRDADSILAFQTLGGTGSLNLAKEILIELISEDQSQKIPLVLDVGWPNHPAIFSDKFSIRRYEHINPETRVYNHENALATIAQAPDNSVLLLQTCGYNDDGMDRSWQQWDEILGIAKTKNDTILLDSAYMGLVNGYENERYPILESVKRGLLTLVSFSASKNMGLYNERLGALYIANAKLNLGNDQLPLLNQLVSRIVRRTYSNPPLMVARAAYLALEQESYFEELNQARARLNENRRSFAGIVEDKLPAASNGGGLFTKINADGFTTKQQSVLEENGILALPNSRINLGGLHLDQIERVGEIVLRALNAKS